MTRWFTSDLHFGHANIIGYCDRPFTDVAQMDRGLIERWNEVVAYDDEVWVLGDVAMGTIEDSLRMIPRLAGTKVLVPGNHDRCWPGRGTDTTAEWADRYRAAGFAEILAPQVDITIGGDIDALACHFPYAGDSHDEDRYENHRPVDEGRVLLHGHVHTRWQIEGRQVNVGCDVWGYRPVTEATIVQALRDAGTIGQQPAAD